MPQLNKPLITISQALKNARMELEKTSDSPTLDTELLLAHCLDKNQTYLHTWPEKQLSDNQLNCFEQLIEKRKTDYPVAYLLGHKPFWTLDLIVTEDVLIPRPETELLVEIALEKIKNIKNPKILDLGTGSGAIALALASERPDAIITASDYSDKALSVAQLNAKKHDLNKNVNFIQSNWYSKISETNFDLIVSNPPYIDPQDPHLQTAIRYEPLQALASKNKGLADIEMIIQDAKSHLKQGGFLMVEHGFDQAENTLRLMTTNILNSPNNIVDLNNKPRCTLAQKLL